MSGRGTAGGVVFQGEVGARAAGLMLSERPLSRIAPETPGHPRRVLFETPAAVDDLLVETDLGEVYVQAKRTITLSEKANSELASVADQFVRQFLAGVVKGDVRRDLEPARDRLVLAVDDDAGAPVADHLRQALDRTRTGAATALPETLAKALRVFTAHLEREWLEHEGAAIGADRLAKLLSVCSVAVVGAAQRQIVEDACRDVVAVPGEEGTLVELLDHWGAKASATGVGGDEAAIRLALGGRTRLKAPPSYQTDVELLDRHTDAVLRRLHRFTSLVAPEGPVQIERPIVSVIAGAAQGTSFVVTGEPGAGKSAVLHAVAQALRSVGPVVLLTVEATAISLDALRADIGLEHPLLEVLAQMPGERPALLVLDALDATRGGLSESTYKQLVERMAELPGWHVVASVRTFDLRMGREWKRLFAGPPVSPAHAEPTLMKIRHVHVPLLMPDELGQLATRTPSLAAAIAIAGEKVAALARNPFNLALLGDLLSAGVSAAAFAKMATRGDLLQRYWEERIADLGLPATVALAGAVKRMISARAVDLAETAVDMSAAAALQELHRVGVLVTESTRRIGFRHHVLFDYAVARLVLAPDRAEALTFLNRSQGIGLLVSASLGYWLESIKAVEPSEAFWGLVGALITDPEIDPIIRVESARLAVEGVSGEERLDAALLRLQAQDAGQGGLLPQLTGALLTRKLGNLPIAPAPWADLLGKLSTPRREQLGSMRAMLNLLIEHDHLCEGDRAALGRAARTMYDAIGDDPRLVAWLAPSVVPVVARTYGTDPVASRTRLQRIFEPKRFGVFGHIETPSLTSEIGSIVEHDPDFAVHIFHRAFLGGDFSAGQKTTMSNSWILGMTSNARQDFGMACHELERVFPRLLAERPEVALRVFGATLKAVCETEQRSQYRQTTVTIPCGPNEKSFTPDGSAVWAWDIDEAGSHEDEAKIFRAFLDWVSGPAEPDVLRRAPDLILEEAVSALAWRALFQAGANRPAELGALLWHSASAEPVLQCDDTRQSAINLIAATHPLVSADHRKALEEGLFRFDFSFSSDPQARRMRLLGKVFAAIGETGLETDAARALLARGRAEGLNFENRKVFACGRGDGHWPRHEAIDAAVTAVAPLLEAVEGLKAASEAAKASASTEKLTAVWQTTEVLQQALAAAGNIDGPIESEVGDALAAGLSLSLRGGVIPADSRHAALAHLLELSRHPDPPSDAKIEAQFARFPCWGSPSIRISAAEGLAELISPETWPEIGERVEELMLKDPHPAVRLQLVLALPRVAAIDTEALWRLVERCVETETNPGVIAHFGGALTHLRREHAERLEPLVLCLTERFENPWSGSGRPADLPAGGLRG
jgi:hypothetical protein